MVQCTWEEWKTLHPATRIPDGAGESRQGHGSHCPNPAHDFIPPFAEITSLHPDHRLPAGELVLGVEAGPKNRAYPLATLHALGTVLNDAIGLRQIVILTKRGSWLSIAFDRLLDGKILEFEAMGGQLLFEDLQTRSRWDFTGRCIEGPLAGRTLGYVPSGLEKWFAWATAHPGCEIFAPL